MANVTIKTSDGKVYTDPRDVHIPRNDIYKEFYRLVDNYQPPKPKDKDKTA